MYAHTCTYNSAVEVWTWPHTPRRDPGRLVANVQVQMQCCACCLSTCHPCLGCSVCMCVYMYVFVCVCIPCMYVPTRCMYVCMYSMCVCIPCVYVSMRCCACCLSTCHPCLGCSLSLSLCVCMYAWTCMYVFMHACAALPTSRRVIHSWVSLYACKHERMLVHVCMVQLYAHVICG